MAEAEGGAFQFLGWRDTELDIDCAFQQLPSGELLCLPSDEDSAWTSSEEESSLFADAGCSRSVREVSVISQCARRGFAQVQSAASFENPCQSEPSYVKIRGSVDSFYRRVGDACQLVAPPESSGQLSGGFFEVEPFTLDGFASGTLREGVESERILPVYLSTADGAEAFWSFRDAEEGFDCELGTMADGLRCVPTNMPLVTGSEFADDTCTSPAAMALSCSQADSVPYVLDVSPHSLPDAELRVLEGGARLGTSYTGTSLPGACLGNQNPYGVFVVGNEVQSSRFVAGALDEAADAQGLIAPIAHAGGWSVAGSRPVRSQDFMGYDCTLLPTSDGVVRCVPAPTLYQVEFADPACSEALIAGGWEATTAVSFADQCPPQVNVLARGEQYAGPVYRKDGAECVFDHEQPLVSRTIYHRLEGELPPGSLAAMPITLH